MANILKNGWMINFIKEQDLLSSYMNKLLMGCFHPGIYNSNIAVYISSNDTGNTTLYVKFKKGTTLLFSNDYIGGNSSSIPCKRNFNNIDLSSWNETNRDVNNILIKYTAEGDTSLSKNIQLKEDNLYSEDLFLFVRVDSDINNSSSQNLNLLIAKMNDDTESSFKDYTYKVIGESDTNAYFIPDGCFNYTSNSTRKLSDSCFLCIGVIRDLDTSDRLTKFTFTTQGLPEYGYSPITNGNSDYPSLVFYRDNNTLKLSGANLRNVLIGNVVCNGFGFSESNIVSEDTSWLMAYANVSDLKPINVNNGWNAVYGYFDTTIKYGVINLSTLSIEIPEEITTSDWMASSSDNLNIVPLDSCEYNVNRLLECIKNKDIWSYVVEELHESEDANKINSIFPVALVYKKEDEPFVNPNNVLSYFDLYYKSSHINIYNGSMNNIFHVIPILEDSSGSTTPEDTTTN